MIAGALCLLTAASARAGVVAEPGVPFTASQLEAAIAIRGGPDEGRLDLQVSSARPGQLVLVATPGGRWEIEIGPASGEAAARVVALYVVELGVAVIVPAVAAEAGTVRTAEGSIPAPPGTRDGYRLALLGMASHGMNPGDFAWMGGAIELTHIGPWIAGGGLSWQYGLTIDRAPGKPISAELLRARVVGGVALGPLELVAGGFAGRLFVDVGDDMLGRWSTGLLGEARAVLPVSSAWAVEIATDAELFRERLEVRFGTEAIGATPRAELGVRIGLAWTESRPR